MQAILFLLGLFAIGCVLYGIAAGVQLIQQGCRALLQGAQGPSLSAGDGAAVAAAPTAPLVVPSPLQHGIAELRALHALHQQGVLTLAEFEGLKRTVLAGMGASTSSVMPGTHCQ